MNVLSEYNYRKRGDEFYTQYADVEKEMRNYDLAGMVVYCNCDNPEASKFVAYFRDNFESSGIRKLMATFNGPNPFLYEYDGINERKTPIRSGLFQDNLALIRICDIVITNPPFSGGLPAKLIDMLILNNKKFIVMAPLYLITNKKMFSYLQNGMLKLGYGSAAYFNTTDGGLSDKMTMYWWTNMDTRKRGITLTKKYDEALYPKFDNIDAIESMTNDIPYDYSGYIGVPISFLLKYDPNQFELVGITRPRLRGKRRSPRLIIRNRNIREGIKKVRITEQAFERIINDICKE